MNVGDVIAFRGGQIGTIIEISPDHGGHALVWIAGEVTFRNPTHMHLESVRKHAEVINESR